MPSVVTALKRTNTVRHQLLARANYDLTLEKPPSLTLTFPKQQGASRSIATHGPAARRCVLAHRQWLCGQWMLGGTSARISKQLRRAPMPYCVKSRCTTDPPRHRPAWRAIAVSLIDNEDSEPWRRCCLAGRGRVGLAGVSPQWPIGKNFRLAESRASAIRGLVRTGSRCF
jgi:hypothetical protein